MTSVRASSVFGAVTWPTSVTHRIASVRLDLKCTSQRFLLRPTAFLVETISHGIHLLFSDRLAAHNLTSALRTIRLAGSRTNIQASLCAFQLSLQPQVNMHRLRPNIVSVECTCTIDAERHQCARRPNQGRFGRRRVSENSTIVRQPDKNCRGHGGVQAYTCAQCR